jgi:hypothetical protein
MARGSGDNMATSGKRRRRCEAAARGKRGRANDVNNEAANVSAPKAGCGGNSNENGNSASNRQ